MKKSTIIIAFGLGLGLTLSSVAAKHDSRNYKNHSYKSQGNSSSNSRKTVSYKSKGYGRNTHKSNYNYYRRPSKKVVIYKPIVARPKVVVVETVSCSPSTTVVYYPTYSKKEIRYYEHSHRSSQAVKIVSSSLNLLGAILNCR